MEEESAVRHPRLPHRLQSFFALVRVLTILLILFSVGLAVAAWLFFSLFSPSSTEVFPLPSCFFLFLPPSSLERLVSQAEYLRFVGSSTLTAQMSLFVLSIAFVTYQSAFLIPGMVLTPLYFSLMFPSWSWGAPFLFLSGTLGSCCAYLLSLLLLGGHGLTRGLRRTSLARWFQGMHWITMILLILLLRVIPFLPQNTILASLAVLRGFRVRPLRPHVVTFVVLSTIVGDLPRNFYAMRSAETVRSLQRVVLSTSENVNQTASTTGAIRLSSMDIAMVLFEDYFRPRLIVMICVAPALFIILMIWVVVRRYGNRGAEDKKRR